MPGPRPDDEDGLEDPGDEESGSGPEPERPDPLDPNGFGDGPLKIDEADREALDNAIIFLELVRKGM